MPYKVHSAQYTPKPIEFLRTWVNPNVPLIIKGGAENWPALKKWNPDYFISVLKDKRVSVAVTPTGYADAVETVKEGTCSKEYFVLPEERTVTISDLFAKLEGGSSFAGG